MTTETSTRTRTPLFLLAALLILVGVAQAQNMFQFPYFHDDEGTHLANSWAMTTEGQLSPYTYSYDDPPVGTFLLAGWTLVTGGVEAFGFSLNSGRVLMLVLHVATAGLIFLITRKLSGSDLAAALALLLFAFSPLATALQRLVVLENIMIVWLLAAVYLVLGEQRTLMHYLASAFFLGVAVLTKGAALVFLPALLVVILTSADRHHRRFATGLWLTLAAVIISFYPLYAQMKEELFPEDWMLGGDFPHVSLLERLGDRGPDTGRFLDYGSGLADAFGEWVDLSSPTADPVLIYGGLISAVFVLLLALDTRPLRPLVWLLLAVAANLVLGGPVYTIDVIVLLPFLAMSVGIVAGQLAGWLYAHGGADLTRVGLALGALAVLLYPFWSFNAHRLEVYTANQVAGQLQATEWVRAYLPEDAVVVTDNYAFVELRATYPHIHDYWRVDTDPAVKFNVLADDVCSIDYVITTPQVYADIQAFNLDLMRRTIDASTILVAYNNNGWPVEIRQVSKLNCAPSIARSTD